MARQMYPRMDEVHYDSVADHQWLHLTEQVLQISDAKVSARSQSTDYVLLEVVPSLGYPLVPSVVAAALHFFLMQMVYDHLLHITT